MSSPTTMADILHEAKMSALYPPPSYRNVVVEDGVEMFGIRTLLTPDLAVTLLENNAGNRNVSQVHVDRLAEQIRLGKWHQNGEAIIISHKGRLLDGQHRCWAVIQSGISIWVMMNFGVLDDEEVSASLDQGRTRSVSNILQMAGINVSSVEKAAGNLLALVTGNSGMDRPAQAEFLRHHLDEIRPWGSWAHEISAKSPMIDLNRRRSRSIGTSALVVLGIHVARSGGDPATFRTFMTGVVNELDADTLVGLGRARINLMSLVNRRLKHGTQLGRSGGGSAFSPLLGEYELYIRTYNRFVRNEGTGKLISSTAEYRNLSDLPPVEKGKVW